jgi:hypothetical protein
MEKNKNLYGVFIVFFLMLQVMDGDAENPDVAAIYVQERQHELGGKETDKEPDVGLLDTDDETGGSSGGGSSGGGSGGIGSGMPNSVGNPASSTAVGVATAAVATAAAPAAAMVACGSGGGSRKRADTEVSNKSTGDYVSGGMFNSNCGVTDSIRKLRMKMLDAPGLNGGVSSISGIFENSGPTGRIWGGPFFEKKNYGKKKIISASFDPTTGQCGICSGCHLGGGDYGGGMGGASGELAGAVFFVADQAFLSGLLPAVAGGCMTVMR